MNTSTALLKYPLSFDLFNIVMEIIVRKADWNGLRDVNNRSLIELSISSDDRVAEKEFRGVINAAKVRFISDGRIPKIKANLPVDVVVFADERDGIRRADPRIGELNIVTDSKVGEYKQYRWLDHLKRCSLSSCIGKLWAIVK